jgi:hypothetical protein
MDGVSAVAPRPPSPWPPGPQGWGSKRAVQSPPISGDLGAIARTAAPLAPQGWGEPDQSKSPEVGGFRGPSGDLGGQSLIPNSPCDDFGFLAGFGVSFGPHFGKVVGHGDQVGAFGEVGIA